MTIMPYDCKSESDQKAVREQLDRILESGPFLQSRRRQRFLEYIITETLAGRGEHLKGYNIAQDVFDRSAAFDPNVDPIVRVEAGRLRDKLREYYEVVGLNDPVHIELPKGAYAPKIEFRHSATLEPAARADKQQLQDISKLSKVDSVRAESLSISPRLSPLEMGWRQPRTLAFAAAVLLTVAASLWAVRAWNSGPPLPDRPSVAVLPFDNIGGDPKWQLFADGITEDIIADLAQSKDLVVIARNSTEVYKGKPIDIRQIGRDLGVKYVLEGSIQPMGERIRVSAQLIETTSGSHIWSERYDRPVDDLFAVQNSVTQRIAATLAGYEGPVAEAERRLLRRKPPANLSAFETYLLAMEAKHKVTKESLPEAEALFHKALKLDPQLARAYVGLATVQYYLIDLGLAPSVDEALSKMMQAGEKAVELDPNDGLTHQALGMAYAYHGKPDQAVAEYDRAETLAPSNADLLLIIAWSLPQFGQSGRAVNLAEQALKLNPHYPDWYNQGFSYVFFFGEQYDKSVKYRLLVKEPLALDYAFLAMAYAYLGRTSEAKAAAANVIKLDPTWVAERYLSGAGGVAEKEGELFVDGARKAGLPSCVDADSLKVMVNLIHVKACDQQRSRTSG